MGETLSEVNSSPKPAHGFRCSVDQHKTYMNKVLTHTFKQPFITESGAIIENPYLAYQCWGQLNTARDNAVIICHALTGNSDAKDWFSGFFGKESLVDTSSHFVLCINHPGSCYGSIGPTSLNPITGQPYQADFPQLTIRDIVRLEQQLLNDLKIYGVELVIGASMGGMVALEFTVMDVRIKNACYIAMGKAHTPWAIGISEAQRLAIAADENWKDGFYDPENQPAKGFAAARAMAMLTYRSPANYTDKFARKKQSNSDQFQMESYLRYQGDKLVKRFDANTYVQLSKAMDSHDVARGRGSFSEVLGRINIPVLVIGISSDLLYPINEQRELAGLIPGASYHQIESPYGHDAFLIEFKQINAALANFMNLTKQAEAACD